nr:hypothetical protein [Candidatus Anoxychlamydiales bacterium]
MSLQITSAFAVIKQIEEHLNIVDFFPQKLEEMPIYDKIGKVAFWILKNNDLPPSMESFDGNKLYSVENSKNDDSLHKRKRVQESSSSSSPEDDYSLQTQIRKSRRIQTPPSGEALRGEETAAVTQTFSQSVFETMKPLLICLSSKTPLQTILFAEFEPKPVCFEKLSFAKQLLDYLNFHNLGTELHDLLKDGKVDSFLSIFNDISNNYPTVLPDLMKVKDSGGSTLLDLAITKNLNNLVEKFLQEINPKDLDVRNYLSKYSLYLSIGKGFISLAEKIIDKMSTEYLDNQGYYTALCLATNKGFEHLAEKIIDKMTMTPKDLAIHDFQKRTTLQLAIEKRFENLAEKIIDKMTPKDLAVQGFQNYPALHIAIEEDFE